RRMMVKSFLTLMVLIIGIVLCNRYRVRLLEKIRHFNLSIFRIKHFSTLIVETKILIRFLKTERQYSWQPIHSKLGNRDFRKPLVHNHIFNPINKMGPKKGMRTMHIDITIKLDIKHEIHFKFTILRAYHIMIGILGA
ncbi:hypothetical protein ACJX0J_031324, partial [Zea mays]